MLHSFQQLAKFNAGTILPASTGNDNNNNTAVTTTAHPNKANLCSLIPGLLILSIVVMTLNNYNNYIIIRLDYIFSASI